MQKNDKTNNDLYLERSDLVPHLMSYETFIKANQRNGSFWQMLPNPLDARMPMVKFEDMRPAFKDKIHAHYSGNIYEYFAKQPIKKLVTKDIAAETFYTTHRFDNGESLSPEHIEAYTKAASWLNMIIKCNDDKKFIKKELNLPLTIFYNNVGEIIKADNIELPACYKRLREKMKEYQENSYTCLINGRFQNNNGTKVKDEIAESTLLEMIAHPNQYDDVLISMQYNTWAKKNDRKEITPGTVGNYRRRNNDLLIMQREGREMYYNEYSKSIKGFRPSTPLYLLESDDNHLDFFFVDWDNPDPDKRYFNKFKSIVVTDSYNDYVLGYAYAQKLSPELVRRAYQNAMHHVKELTGGRYLPHEVKTDRWAIGQLEPFYKGLGNYFKTPVGSKRRGYLEQFFGSIHWKRAIKLGTSNYTGNNLTALNEGVNKEVLFANKKEYPTIQEAPQHIEDFFHRLRMMPDKNGNTKQANWLAAFNATSPDKLRPVSDEQFLLKLGTLRPEINTITSRGLDISINGQAHNFDIPDKYYFDYKGCQVHTMYDPNDLSRILVTDFRSLRFIATTPYYQPRALADYKTGDRAILNQHLENKQRHVALVAQKQDERKEVLHNNGVDISSLLTSGFVLKADRQMAELEYQTKQLTGSNERRAIDPISKM